jgi:hypothetical protein
VLQAKTKIVRPHHSRSSRRGRLDLPPAGIGDLWTLRLAGSRDGTLRLLLLVFALFVLVEAAACHRTHSAPPSPKPESMGGSGGEPGVAEVLGIMERAARFFMIVDTNNVPTCQPWRSERSKLSPGTADGVLNFVQDLSPGTSRLPVRLRVAEEQGRIVVSDSRVIVPGGGKSGIGASLGSCTKEEQWTACDGDKQALTPTSHDNGTIATKEGVRWYLDEKACQAALSGHRMSDPVVCSPVLSRHPAGVDIAPVPKAFEQILASGGRLVRKGRSPTNGAPICEPWSVRVSRDGRRELMHMELKREKCLEYLFKTSLQIDLLGNAIRWAGPHGKVQRIKYTCREAAGVGEGSIGCGDYLPVSGEHRDKVLIGRESWYLNLAACERDLRSTSPTRSL